MMVAVGTNSCSSSSRFGPSSALKRGHAREVAAWPVQAGDKSKLDRVAAGQEDDRNRRGRRLGRQRRRSAARGNHGHLTTNQIGRQRRQSIVLALRPAIFDRHVPALDIAGFAQALAERAPDGARTGQAIRLPRNPITGIAGCCARAAIGHAAAAPPRSVMNSRRFNGSQCIWSLPATGRIAGYRTRRDQSAGIPRAAFTILDCCDAHSTSEMGHKPHRRPGPGTSLCPQYLRSRQNFVRRERRQVPIATLTHCSKGTATRSPRRRAVAARWALRVRSPWLLAG